MPYHHTEREHEMEHFIARFYNSNNLKAWFVYAVFLYGGILLIDDMRTSFGVMAIAFSYWVMTTFISGDMT